HVLSGETRAVEEAVRRIEEETVAQAVVIADGLPMHSSLFESVAARFRPFLEAVSWRRPARPYIPNVTAELVLEPTAADFIDLLQRQVASPVRWRATIDRVGEQFPGTTFIEVGPKTVLSRMLRRWKDNPRFATDGPDGLVVAEPVEALGSA